jgi:hypothetical protein
MDLYTMALRCVVWPQWIALGDVPTAREGRGHGGELRMAYLQRWFVMLAVGGALLIGLSSCVVAPVDLAPPGYVASPPVVVIRPYRPHRYYGPYRPYGGWYHHPYRC